jgi:hypothetical protein
MDGPAVCIYLDAHGCSLYMIHPGRAGSYRTAAHHILFSFLLFDSDDLYRKVERNFDLQSLDPTNLLVMVGWNTAQGQQPRLSLSLPASQRHTERHRR